MVALATVAGALGGALATAGFGKLTAGDTAQASVHDTALETSVARLDAEIVALKASLEHNSKTATGQINKASDRLDKVEKAQADLPRKSPSSVKPSTSFAPRRRRPRCGGRGRAARCRKGRHGLGVATTGSRCACARRAGQA